MVKPTLLYKEVLYIKQVPAKHNKHYVHYQAFTTICDATAMFVQQDNVPVLINNAPAEVKARALTKFYLCMYT